MAAADSTAAQGMIARAVFVERVKGIEPSS
jgi:hypothetical protein